MKRKRAHDPRLGCQRGCQWLGRGVEKKVCRIEKLGFLTSTRTNLGIIKLLHRKPADDGHIGPTRECETLPEHRTNPADELEAAFSQANRVGGSLLIWVKRMDAGLFVSAEIEEAACLS
jgi:hypothetical protein